MTRPNTPEARQEALRHRLDAGEALSLSALSREFGVSPDSIRRDLKALESQGLARCIRGGALPPQPLARATLDRLPEMDHAALTAAALPLIADGMVVFMDGGTTIAALAAALPRLPGALIVTPAPAVALATLRRGTPTHLIGGRLSPSGAIAVGSDSTRALSRIAADLALLGVCGIDPGFGLSAEDSDEAAVKRAMLDAAHRSALLSAAAKLGTRSRFHVAPCVALDILITDAPTEATPAYTDLGMEIRHA
ncbi:DeoR/GlpR family DNA-binding transcription regulator [Ponticoccus sp. (in: a-proteobacteria)]|uniref:DeoR/GlpR family DNA-binding transcription regulator n=1 Tax=Ponticoccus sp. (in: a-proteobacteria) TaxID=1925025 RepID=UPI003AB6F2F1